MTSVALSVPRAVGPGPEGGARWVCLRSTRKDRTGEYFVSDAIFEFRTFKNGRSAFGLLVYGDATLNCSDFDLGPWPEMENLGDQPRGS